MNDTLENKELFPALLNNLKKLNIPVIIEKDDSLKHTGVFSKVCLTMDEELKRRTGISDEKDFNTPILEFYSIDTKKLINAYHMSQILNINDNILSNMVRYSLRISSVFSDVCKDFDQVPKYLKSVFFLQDEKIKIYIMEIKYDIQTPSGPGN